MKERDKIIELLIKEKGGSIEDYFRLMDIIAYHESNHTMRSDIYQLGGGPGRGKYQFEEGKDAEGITAARRTKRYYKKNGLPIPEWLEKASKGDTLNVSNLTSAQQDILFLANMKEHPTADLSKLWEGEETIPEFWAKYHWRGKESDLNDRLKSFNTSLNKYNELGVDAVREMSLENDYSGQNPYYQEPDYNLYPELNDIFNSSNPSSRFQNNGDLNSMLQQVRQEQQMQQMQSQPLNNEVAQPQPQFPLQDQKINKTLTRYKGGGTHEENPLGGIPVGKDSVESDETSVNLPNGKFVFSNRFGLDKQYSTKEDSPSYKGGVNYNNQFANGGLLNGGYGGPGQPPYNEIKEMTKSYIKSPKYKERLESSGYNNIDEEIKYRLNNINNTETIYQDDLPSGSIYDRNNKKVIIDRKQSTDEGVPTEVIEAHEYAHSEIDPNKENYDYQDIGIKSTRLNMYDNLNLKHRIKKEVYEKNSHNSFPDENKADLNAFRYELKDFYDAGKEDFTKEHLRKSKNSVIKKRLLKNYSEKDLIWLMNNIASVDNKNNNQNIAAYGGYMNTIQPLNLNKKTSSKKRNKY